MALQGQKLPLKDSEDQKPLWQMLARMSVMTTSYLFPPNYTAVRSHVLLLTVRLKHHIPWSYLHNPKKMLSAQQFHVEHSAESRRQIWLKRNLLWEMLKSRRLNYSAKKNGSILEGIVMHKPLSQKTCRVRISVWAQICLGNNLFFFTLAFPSHQELSVQ